MSDGSVAMRAFGKLMIIALPWAIGFSGAVRSDDLRVLHLESEVRRLERELELQARRIDQLERSARTAGVPNASVSEPYADSSPAWLVSTNWDRLRPGMKTADVVALLGRPTSVRTDAQGHARSLWYAMELGPSAVLSGNVQLSDAGVSKINKPMLR